jgi:hypothetical protein
MISALLLAGMLLFTTGCPATTGDDCTWTITNDLEDGGDTWDILFVRLRANGETAWLDDELGNDTLAFGESFDIVIAATTADEPQWDIQAEDEDADTYTRLNDNWCADGEDLSTTFTLADID